MTEKELLQKKAKNYFKVGLEAVERGSFSMALRQLRLAEAYGYSPLKVLFYTGIVKKYQNRSDEAQECFTALAAKTTKFPELHLHVGNIYRMAGKNQAAMENYKLAIKHSTDILCRATVLREINALGILDTKRLAGLIEICDRNVKSKKKHSFYDKRGIAILEMLRGDYLNAFLGFRSLVQINPEYAELYRDLALLHIEEKSYKRAIFALQNGLCLIKNDPEMFWLLAYCNMSLGRMPSTLSVLRYMLKVALGTPVLLANMGNILVSMGRRVAAIKAYKKALLLDSSYSPALFNLATLYHESGSLDLAQSYYEKILEHYPDDYLALYNVGILYYETGDYIASLKSLRQSLEIKPEFKEAEKNLRFVFMAKLCYPQEGPEEELGKISRYYWLGLGSVIAIMLFTIVQGWI